MLSSSMKRDIVVPPVEKKQKRKPFLLGNRVSSVCGGALERLCDLSQAFDCSRPPFPQDPEISSILLDTGLLRADSTLTLRLQRAGTVTLGL